jgi:glycosyltransferase involved in cell wall biosynthesis
LIDFVGPIFGKRKWALYKDADLFVLPTHSENFGIVVPESLASGTPVITTYGTPWRELNEEKCGWWIPIGKDSLVTALRSFLLKTPEELKEMGQRGRKLVEDKYSSEKVAKQFLAMYENLISD